MNGKDAVPENTVPPVGARREPVGRSMFLTRIGAWVRSAVIRAGLIDYAATFDRALQAVAVHAVRAAQFFGLDQKNTVTGKRIVAELEERIERVKQRRLENAAADEEYWKAQEELADSPRGLSYWKQAFAVIGIFGLSFFTWAASAKLLAPALVIAFYGPMYSALALAGDVLAEARNAAALICGAVIAPLTISVLVTSGRFSRVWKLPCLLLEVLYAVGFALLRGMGEGFSILNIALSITEAAILLPHAVGLSIIASWMNAMSQTADAWQLKKNRSLVCDRRRSDARARLLEAELGLVAQTNVVQEREEADAERERLEALAAATAHALHLTTTLELRSHAESGDAPPALNSGLAEFESEPEESR